MSEDIVRRRRGYCAVSYQSDGSHGGNRYLVRIGCGPCPPTFGRIGNPGHHLGDADRARRGLQDPSAPGFRIVAEFAIGYPHVVEHRASRNAAEYPTIEAELAFGRRMGKVVRHPEFSRIGREDEDHPVLAADPRLRFPARGVVEADVHAPIIGTCRRDGHRISAGASPVLLTLAETVRHRLQQRRTSTAKR